MVKKHNRFIIDTSRRGKFRETDIIIHALPPKFIAQAKIISDQEYKEVESHLSGVSLRELTFASKQMHSSKWVVVIVIDWWDKVDAKSDSELKQAVRSLHLALKLYINNMLE